MYTNVCTLWKEKAGNPEGLWLSVFDPVVNERAPENQISDPAAERLQRRVRGVRPQLRNLVVEERCVDHLQLFAHHDETFDSFLQLLQRSLQHNAYVTTLRRFVIQKHFTCAEKMMRLNLAQHQKLKDINFKNNESEPSTPRRRTGRTTG